MNTNFARFFILTAVKIQVTVFCIMTLCRNVTGYHSSEVHAVSIFWVVMPCSFV